MHKTTPRRPLSFGNMSGGAFLAGGHSRGYAYVSTHALKLCNTRTHAKRYAQLEHLCTINVIQVRLRKSLDTRKINLCLATIWVLFA